MRRLPLAISSVAVLVLAVCMQSVAATAVDVLVAYDESAAAWLSVRGYGQADFAAMAIGQMNEVLPNTGLDCHFRFNLAGTFASAAAAVGEVPQERLLDAIRAVCDGTTGRAKGAWRDVQSAREASKADIVVVLIDSRREGPAAISGVSWQLGQGGRPANVDRFAPFAYAVCAVQDVAGSQIMAHEVGHVMGAGHSDELEDDPGPQQQPYSSAYYAVSAEGERYATILGYSYKKADDAGYRIIPCFSSSVHTWNGLRLGDALHDNTRTLAETCGNVARFRLSGNENGGEVQSVGRIAAKITVRGSVRDGAGELRGLVQLTVSKTDKKGYSKISGCVYGLDGKKRTVKGVKVTPEPGEGGGVLKNVSLSVKGFAAPLVVTVGGDGSLTGSFDACKVSLVRATGNVSSSAPHFACESIPALIRGLPVLREVTSGGQNLKLVPDGEGVCFDASASKWRFAKPMSVKYVKDKHTGRYELVADQGKDGTRNNACALKLSLSPKTGVFKGSFVLYLETGRPDKPKLKKVKCPIAGLVADGEGIGLTSFQKKSIISKIRIR